LLESGDFVVERLPASAENMSARDDDVDLMCAPASTERRISATRSASGDRPAGNPVETAAT
jgi:hypothetical protein